MSNLSDIPLLYNGDAYHIHVEIFQQHVLVLGVTIYYDNQNSVGVFERYRDLDPETKKAVLNQVKRRHPINIQFND